MGCHTWFVRHQKATNEEIQKAKKIALDKIEFSLKKYEDPNYQVNHSQLTKSDMVKWLKQNKKRLLHYPLRWCHFLIKNPEGWSLNSKGYWVDENSYHNNFRPGWKYQNLIIKSEKQMWKFLSSYKGEIYRKEELSEFWKTGGVEIHFG